MFYELAVQPRRDRPNGLVIYAHCRLCHEASPNHGANQPGPDPTIECSIAFLASRAGRERMPWIQKDGDNAWRPELGSPGA